MTEVDKHLRETLIAISQQMFPHRGLAKEVYARVIDRIDSELEEWQKMTLEAGVRHLDEKYETPFLELSENYRIDTLKSLENSEFFRSLHGYVLRNLYSDSEVWAHFGYEGPSSHLGGYIKRGFSDASWIPDK